MSKLMWTALAVGLLLSGCSGEAPTVVEDKANNQMGLAEVAPVPLGKPGVAQGVTITIKSIDQKARIGADSYALKTEPGETFVIVRYSIKNTAKEPLSSLDQPEIELVDGAGQSFVADSQAGTITALLSEDGSASSDDLNPMVTAKKIAVWKIAKASFDLKAWRLKATLGGLSAKLGKAVTWPAKDDTSAPIMFSLK